MTAIDLDYDLMSALGLAGVALEAIAAGPLAVWTGENEGEDWRWVLPMKDGRYGFLHGGCDYTGWDCQAFAEVEYAPTAEGAARLEAADNVRAELLRQLAHGKAETARERIGRDLGLL